MGKRKWGEWGIIWELFFFCGASAEENVILEVVFDLERCVDVLV